MSNATPPTPTLLFVPGSWHKPSCYDKIITPLSEQHNLRCIAITLPSTTGDPSKTFKDDVGTARDAMTAETSQGRNVVVIAHSYGGMVGNSAIKGFTNQNPKHTPGIAISREPVDADTDADTDTDTDTGPRGYVIGLILIASGFTLTGLTFMDPFFNHPPPFWQVNKSTGFAELTTSPRQLFYHDLDEPEANYWVSQLTPQSLKSLFEGRDVSYAGWMDVPVWYLGTSLDKGLPVLVQRMQVGMAREMKAGFGSGVVHREIVSSHSPFLSRVEETVGVVLEAVDDFRRRDGQEETGLEHRGGSERETVSAGGVVVISRTELWTPSTWLRFGLPLAFGHVLGKGMRLYYWVKRALRSRSS
ncbi:Alpha/beta hydrolase family-domain-containing protein [Aspergillus crustosus]